MNVEAIARYARGRAYQGRVLRSFYKAGYLDGSEILAVTGAGALPYYSGLPAIDVHGLNDVRIAHQPLSQRGKIGHEKYATPEYLIERGVVIYDIFNHIVLPPSASGASAEANEKGWELERPDHGPPSYEGLRRVELRAKGHVLQFGTALDEAELRERFQRFEIRLGGFGGLDRIDRIDRADSSL